MGGGIHVYHISPWAEGAGYCSQVKVNLCLQATAIPYDSALFLVPSSSRLYVNDHTTMTRRKYKEEKERIDDYSGSSIVLSCLCSLVLYNMF